VRLIDIFPSIMDFLGLPSPSPSRDKPRAYIEGRRRAHLGSYIETFYPGELRLVRARRLVDGDWKYIALPAGALQPRIRPGELTNSFAASGGTASSMNAAWRAHQRRAGWPPPRPDADGRRGGEAPLLATRALPGRRQVDYPTQGQA